MSIDKILKEQDDWLKKAPQSFQLQRIKPADTALLKSTATKRIGEIEMRIERLTEAREAAVKRYDEAIAAEKSEIVRLKAEMKKMPSVDR